MPTRTKSLIVFFILIAVLLSACGPDANTSPAGDDLGPAATAWAEEGTAMVSYLYEFKNDLMNFKIEPEIPLIISDSDTPGSFKVEGIAVPMVQLEMLAAGGAGTCLIQCQMRLNFVAEGKIELDEKGSCQIPMSFFFQPQQDEIILTGGCPDLVMDTMDCTALSAVMMDPSIYTFTKGKLYDKKPSDPAITLRAEIRDVVFPAGMRGICDW